MPGQRWGGLDSSLPDGLATAQLQYGAVMQGNGRSVAEPDYLGEVRNMGYRHTVPIIFIVGKEGK